MVAAGLSFVQTSSTTTSGNTTVADEFDAIGDGFLRLMPTTRTIGRGLGVWVPRPSINIDGAEFQSSFARWIYTPGGDSIDHPIGMRKYNSDLSTWTEYVVRDQLGVTRPNRLEGFAVMAVSMPSAGDWIYPSAPTHLILSDSSRPRPYVALQPTNDLDGGEWIPNPMTLSPWRHFGWSTGNAFGLGRHQAVDTDAEALAVLVGITTGATAGFAIHHAVKAGSPLDVRLMIAHPFLGDTQHAFYGLPPSLAAGAEATVRPAVSGETPDAPELVIERTDTLLDLTTTTVEAARVAMTLDSVDGNDHTYVRAMGSIGMGTLSPTAIAYQFSSSVDVQGQSSTGVVSRHWHKRPCQFLPMAVSNGHVGGTGWFPGWMWRPPA